MEIAFFTESFPPTRDGVAVEVGGLARALTRLGHRVRVFAPNPVKGARPDRFELDGIDVTRVRSVPVPVYSEYRWPVFPFLAVRGVEFGDQVDVVHVHTPGVMGGIGFLAARRWGKPLVGTFHTNVWEMRESFADRPLVLLFLRIARTWSLGTYWRCDVTTAPTEAARTALLEYARKPFRRPVEVVPNGIEVERFRPGLTVPDWRARCGLGPDPLVTYLGRLTSDKGVHRFLDAVAEVSPSSSFGAVVVGSGPEERAVRERLRDDSRLARVRYVGPVAEEEKPSLLAQSDVFVLPSTADTSSLALLEAMASGAACIASNEGGPADILEDGRTGRLVPVRAPGAVGTALRELLEDGPGRAALGSAARSTVLRTASIESSARRFISLYELLLEERRDHGRLGHPG